MKLLSRWFMLHAVMANFAQILQSGFSKQQTAACLDFCVTSSAIRLFKTATAIPLRRVQNRVDNRTGRCFLLPWGVRSTQKKGVFDSGRN